MTVQELIDELQKIEDKSLEVGTTVSGLGMPTMLSLLDTPRVVSKRVFDGELNRNVFKTYVSVSRFGDKEG